jgi:hypothetical protein
MSGARENSEIVESLRQISERLNSVAEQSWLWSAGRTLKRWTRHSYLYRWLTAEPDPDVIVIDLRETYTVGPILAAMDRTGRFVSNTRAGQACASALGSLSAEVERRPVRVFSIVVLVALVTNVVVSLALGPVGPTGLGARLVLAGLALLGTRSSMTAAELTESRLWKLLEPPEVEGERRTEPDDDGDRD